MIFEIFNILTGIITSAGASKHKNFSLKYGDDIYKMETRRRF